MSALLMYTGFYVTLSARCEAELHELVIRSFKDVVLGLDPGIHFERWNHYLV